MLSLRRVETSVILMSGNTVLLDTNIVVSHFRTPGAYDEALEQHQLLLPYVVAAELYSGALHSGRPEENRELVDTFLASVSVLTCDIGTAKCFAEIWNVLADQGTPIPQNDIWIASLAIQHDLPLVTKDSHFDNITKLNRITW